MEKKQRKYKELLKEKNYMKYLIGDTVSRFGDSIDAIAFSLLIYKITGSVELMALLVAINYIPSVILQPFTGVLVDYYSKKRIQLITNVGRALCVFGVIGLYLMDSLEVYHLFLFTIINSTLESFQMPSGVALVPLILKEEQYSSGIALKQTSTKVAELVGLALAGGLVSMIGIVGALTIDALTFLICGLMMGTLQLHGEKINHEKIQFNQYFEDLKEGFSYIKIRKIIWNICIFSAVINFMFAPFNAIQIPYIQEILKLGPETLSILGVSFSLGMLCGSVLYPLFEGRVKNRLLFILSGIMISLLYFGLVSATFFDDPMMKVISVGIGAILGGIGIGIINLVIGVTFAKKVSPEYMGRVGGVAASVAMCAMPIGAFFTSLVVGTIGMTALILLCACLIVALYGMQFFNKELYEME